MPEGARDADLEEIRIAVVMNGGLSLAVWIGGVALELNRLTRASSARPDSYSLLLDLLRSTARVDVIAGTSAGGLNGAFLALGAVYDQPLGSLGELWAQQGDMGTLLRSPTESDPPSLMRGDDYFLPKLKDALRLLFPSDGKDPATVEEVPISLFMTTSMIDAQPRRFLDMLGSEIVEEDHRGLFTFERGERVSTDPFADESIIERLALAARSTASFPIAFEASFVPINETGPPLHPDMAEHIKLGASGFVVDGGALVNKPMGPAIAAIARQPAGRQVRRLMAYVNPDPGVVRVPTPKKADESPTLAKLVQDSLVTLPRAQSIQAELEWIRENNRSVRERRYLRADLLSGMGDLGAAARQLYPSYHDVRVTRIAHDAATLVLERSGTQGAGAWQAEEIVAALQVQGEIGALGPPPELPTGRLDRDTWQWGADAAQRLGWVALDLLRLGINLAPLDDTVREPLREGREQLHALLATLRGFRKAERRFWKAAAEALGKPRLDAGERAEQLRRWAEAVALTWPEPTMWGDPSPESLRRSESILAGFDYIVTGMIGLLIEARPHLQRILAAADQGVDPRAQRLTNLMDAVIPVQGEVSPAAVAQRLVELEVVNYLVNGPPEGPDQDVELFLVSGNSPNSFGGPTAGVDKLAGIQLGHFGAFYKRSWRVNDWIWGRLDGVTRLVQATLGADRLRQLGLSSRAALEGVAAAATWSRLEADREFLMRAFDAKDCLAELAFLDDPAAPLPRYLPACSAAIGRALQLDVLREELPRLVAAVRHDIDSGASRDGAGAGLVAAYEAAEKQAGAQPISPDQVFALFTRAGVGAEKILDEFGTDLFAATVSKAAAVGVAATSASKSGLGPVAALTKTVRGVTLTLYALVYGAVIGSAFGAAAVNLALAIGGAMLSISFLTDDAPELFGAVGTLLVVAGLLLAFLRARMWALVAVVIVPVVLLGVMMVGGPGRQFDPDGTDSLILIVGAIAVSMLLGSMGAWPPLIGSDPKKRRWVFWLSLVLVGAAGVFLQAKMPPGGIIPFEFSFNLGGAWEFIDGWKADDALQVAIRQVQFDFMFLTVYWLPLACLCAWTAELFRRRRFPRSFVGLGSALAWGALAAAMLDAVENVGLLKLLRAGEVAGSLSEFKEGLSPLVPLAVYVAASLKFALLVAGILYVIVGWARELFKGGDVA